MTWKQGAAPIALGLVLAAILMRWPDPAGPNGYFYLKNIQELSAFRGFYFHDYSLALLFPAALNLVLRNAHWAWALAVGLTAAAIPWLAAAALQPGAAPRSRSLPYFLALFAATQFPLLELALVYFKNAFALACALAAVASLAWALRDREGAVDSRARWLMAFLAAVAAIFAHKTMLFWLFVLGGIFFSPEIQRGFRPPRRLWVALGAVATLALLASRFFYRGLYAQAAAALSWKADPDPFRFWLQASLREEPSFALPTALLFLAAAYPAYRAWRFRGRYGLALGLYLLLLALDFHPWQAPGSTGLHYRLWLLLPVIPCWCLGEIYLHAKPYARLALALSLLGLFAWEREDMAENFSQDFIEYSRLAPDVMRLGEFVGARDRLICRHGLEFYVDYATNIRCRSLIDHDPREETWRLAYLGEIASADAIRFLRARAPLRVGTENLLIRERDWQEGQRRFHLRSSGSNPSEERPDFVDGQY